MNRPPLALPSTRPGATGRWLALVVALAGVLFAGAALAAKSTTALGTVLVRSEADLEGPIVAIVKRGEPLRVEEGPGPWLRVSTVTGASGHASGRLDAPGFTPDESLATPPVSPAAFLSLPLGGRLLVSPAPGSRPVGDLPEGTFVRAYERHGMWVLVASANNSSGWIPLGGVAIARAEESEFDAAAAVVEAEQSKEKERPEGPPRHDTVTSDEAVKARQAERQAATEKRAEENAAQEAEAAAAAQAAADKKAADDAARAAKKQAAADKKAADDAAAAKAAEDKAAAQVAEKAARDAAARQAAEDAAAKAAKDAELAAEKDAAAKKAAEDKAAAQVAERAAREAEKAEKDAAAKKAAEDAAAKRAEADAAKKRAEDQEAAAREAAKSATDDASAQAAKEAAAKAAADKKAADEAARAAEKQAAAEKKAADEAARAERDAARAAEKQAAAEKKAADEAARAERDAARAAEKQAAATEPAPGATTTTPSTQTAEERAAEAEAKKAADDAARAEREAARAAEKQAAADKRAADEAARAAEKQASADKRTADEAARAAEKDARETAQAAAAAEVERRIREAAEAPQGPVTPAEIPAAVVVSAADAPAKREKDQPKKNPHVSPLTAGDAPPIEAVAEGHAGAQPLGAQPVPEGFEPYDASAQLERSVGSLHQESNALDLSTEGGQAPSTTRPSYIDASGSSVSTSVVSQIVARVNDEILTNADFERKVTDQKEELRRADPARAAQTSEDAVRRRVLQRSIEQMLLVDQARIMGMQMDRVYQTAKERFMKQAGIKDDVELLQLLDASGRTWDDFRRELLWESIPPAILSREVYDKITVSEEEIASHYRLHQEEWAEPACVRLREIVLQPEAKETTRDFNLRLDGVLDRLDGGEDFCAVAKSASAASSKESCGLLPDCFTAKQLDERVAQVAFRMKPGDIEPVTTDWGYHVVRLEESRPRRQRALAEVREDVMKKLRVDRAMDDQRRYLETLREGAHVEIAPEYGRLLERSAGVTGQ